MQSDIPTHKGFTLVEVALAIAIAGIGLATLIVLQTRILNTYSYERDLTKAVLYAQYLMTFIETEAKTINTGSDSGSLVDLLDKRGYFDLSDESSENERELIKDWFYFQEIEKEDFGLGEILAQIIPNLGKDFEIARRVRLTINWGTAQNQQYTLTFFTRKEQKT